MKKIFLSILVFAIGLVVHAEVKLPKVFADHMVLQRGIEIPVWGWADSRERVEVVFQDKSYSARADKEGKWMVKMAVSKAGGPYELRVKGKNELVFKDVLIGDVWLCGGQSNMEWALSKTIGGEDSIAKADFPNIRFFEVGRNVSIQPIQDVPEGKWSVCSPETVPDFSAIAYYFGKSLQADMDVPIGLLDINWGGTVSEAWTSSEALLSHSDFKEKIEKQQSDPSIFEQATNKGPNNWPSGLFHGMLEPVIPFGIKGAIWYQGESNAGRAYQYREIFPLMIQDWRKHWGQGEFPFLWVQLANYMKADSVPVDSNWAELREAQTMTLSIPNTGQAVIIDKGEAEDIHPRDKWTVGERLAKVAKKVAYGKDLVYSGPTYNKMSVEGNKVKIEYENVGSGIRINDKYGYIKGFAIAGEDKVFHWANAQLDGNAIIVYSEKVKQPKSVRYAWGNNPDDANVYNKEGLPANPFRTDTWEGITYGKK